MARGITPEARKARNEYVRKWKQNNKDRVKQHQINYWEKRVKQMQAEAAKAVADSESE